jgi:tripartite-type tricarboxylate transporter receptor subunit TctC
MKWTACFLVAVCLTGAVMTASAQDFPTRPVKVVVPYPPGQGADILVRIVTDRLSAQLGQPFVVENKAGASGTIGTYWVVSQPADGYTLVMGSSGAMTISPTLQREIVKYDSLKDFEPIAGLATVAQVFVVNASSPIKSIADLIATAKKTPGQVTFASSGKGSTQHLFVEYFAALASISVQHIPYKGAAPALTGLLGGQVMFMSDTIPAVHSQIKAGTVRALGVTSASRSPLLPDVPTLAESGIPSYSAEGWITILAPANTPAPIADKLYAEIRKTMSDPDLKKKIVDMGYVEMTMPRAKMRDFFRAEIEKWKNVIQAAKITIE